MENAKLQVTLLLLFLTGGISAQSYEGGSWQRGENKPCSNRSISLLNRGQLQQIREDQGFIQHLKNNPVELSNSANQRPVVTLTPQQENQILRNFPEIFKSRAEFDQSQATLGEITSPAPLCDRDGDGNCPLGCFTDNAGICRRLRATTPVIACARDGDGTCPGSCFTDGTGLCRRPATASAVACDQQTDGTCPQDHCFTDALGTCWKNCSLNGTCPSHVVRREAMNRVCQPALSSSPVVLARKPNGDVVQLAQNVSSNNQWIFEETCAADTGLNGEECKLAERHIPALFVNLCGTPGFDYDYAVIYCCVAVE